jgi:hypothetical protein
VKATLSYPQPPLAIESRVDEALRSGGCMMVDLLESAERCRVKAAQCEQLAEETVSPLFAECFRQLAQMLVSTAEMDEDFVRRDLAMKHQADQHT